MENVTVNWTNRRSDGYAAEVVKRTGSLESAYFDAPLISHIEGDLWMGGCDNGPLDSDFLTVVSLYPWGKFLIGPETTRVEFKAYDQQGGFPMDLLEEASDAVLAGLEKGKTLVHCQAGLNRSGLVAAYTMMRLGKTAQEAIDLLREKRDGLVLCNHSFVEILHGKQHELEV